LSGGSTFGYAANRRRIRLVHEHTGELIHLSSDGHVDEAGAILAVLHDEAAEERLVDFRLELDVLGARHLLQLLRNHELLLVFELDRGSHRRDLRVRRLAEQSFKLGDDGLDLVFTSLVHQQVQEVARERVEASLLAELRQNILLLFRDDGRVGQEARNAGVRLDVRVERLHIGVHLFERAGGLARVDERRGVTAGHRVGLGAVHDDGTLRARLIRATVRDHGRSRGGGGRGDRKLIFQCFFLSFLLQDLILPPQLTFLS